MDRVEYLETREAFADTRSSHGLQRVGFIENHEIIIEEKPLPLRLSCKQREKEGVVHDDEVCVPRSGLSALEEAGFERTKRNISWDQGDDPDMDMYILNWDEFHKSMEKKKNLYLEHLTKTDPKTFSSQPEIINGMISPPGLKLR